MQVLTKKQLAAIADSLKQGMAEAGFTGVKLDRQEMPQGSFDELMKEEGDDDDTPSVADFSVEISYHRVATDQGSFGLWLQPYPTLDLTGMGLDIASFFPPGQDLSGMPAGWSFIGMDENIFKRLFDELAKKHGQP